MNGNQFELQLELIHPRLAEETVNKTKRKMSDRLKLYIRLFTVAMATATHVSTMKLFQARHKHQDCQPAGGLPAVVLRQT